MGVTPGLPRIKGVTEEILLDALAAYTPTANLAPVATSGSASDLLTGTLANARLSPQVVRSDFSYPDPSWVTSIAASKLTGTITDARLSSNVPLKDAVSNAFTGNLTSPRIYVSGTNPQISPSTSDGADNRTLILMGGGEFGPTTRGPHITLAGLEAATRPGNIELATGLNGEIRMGGELGGGFVETLRIVSAGKAQFRNATWHGSISDGLDRVLYALSSTTYYKGHGTGTIHEWRNGSDSAVMTLSQLGNLLAIGTIQVGNATGPVLGNTAGSLDVRNSTNTDWGRVNANEFRLASNTFSRVAQLNTATGGWGGGYNFNLDGGAFRRDSTGSVNSVFYNVGAIQWFSETSGAPGVISPRMTLSPTLFSLNDAMEIFGTGAANKFAIYNNVTKDYVRFSVNSDTGEARFAGGSGDIYIRPYGGATFIRGGYTIIEATYSDIAFRTNAGTLDNTAMVLSGLNASVSGTIQAGGGSGPRLKNGGGLLQIRNSTDSAFASAEADQFAGSAFSFVDGASRTSKFYFYSNNGNSVFYIRDPVNARQHMQFNPGATSSSAETYIWSKLIVDAEILSQGTTAGIDTRDRTTNERWVWYGSASSARLFNSVYNGDVFSITNAGHFRTVGHITSAFQNLPADPTTLDIPSGLNRLVKNTASGEIRNWVNDAGVMKKSPAYV